MKVIYCFVMVFFFAISLDAQVKQFNIIDNSIPEEFIVRDTVIVFDAATYEETITVTTRDSRKIGDKITVELQLSGASANYVDTIVTFDPETFLESVHIYKVKVPIEFHRLYEFLDHTQKKELDKRIERQTLEVEISLKAKDFELFVENNHLAFILSIVNSGGEIFMSKEIDAYQRNVRIRDQEFKSGTYKIIRSDGGQVVKLVVKE